MDLLNISRPAQRTVHCILVALVSWVGKWTLRLGLPRLRFQATGLTVALRAGLISNAAPASNLVVPILPE